MTERNVIILIGLVNLTLLGFLTPLLDGDLLAAQDPLFFSWPGVVIIALWGLAYIAVAPVWDKVPWLLLVFALEKLLFDLRWVHWIIHNKEALPALYEQDLMVALFYSGYGIWDGACALVFLWYFMRARQKAAV
ncbi:hypothetical protein [Alcanivorax sp. 1008]|uniref:hypothetical protein n=1 Tax=Alcanivorax sp. 1008 TaxID=2816853 RepID=UPI001D57162E|nr:hypothetical protein [Alcanivorax sp. 1008]MCC1496183.1 hypothetical protein [Alcanivorax sp. 1008]